MADECICKFPQTDEIIGKLEEKWPLGANSDNMRILLSQIATRIALQELDPVAFVQVIFKAVHDFSSPRNITRPDRIGVANNLLNSSFAKLVELLCEDQAEFQSQAMKYFEEAKASWAAYP